MAGSSAGQPDLELEQNFPEVASHFFWKPIPLSLRRSPLTSQQEVIVPA